jgi:hypothetical protein
MPAFIVNISSMVMRALIHFLCTLELTVERHYCSNLKHKSSDPVEFAVSGS